MRNAERPALAVRCELTEGRTCRYLHHQGGCSRQLRGCADTGCTGAGWNLSQSLYRPEWTAGKIIDFLGAAAVAVCHYEERMNDEAQKWRQMRVIVGVCTILYRVDRGYWCFMGYLAR